MFEKAFSTQLSAARVATPLYFSMLFIFLFYFILVLPFRK